MLKINKAKLLCLITALSVISYQNALTVSAAPKNIQEDKPVKVDKLKNDTTSNGQNDTTPPTSPLIITGGLTANQVYTSGSVTVSLETPDKSKVDKTEYMVSGSGVWVQYMAPLVLSNEGTYVVQARNADKNGNVSEITSRTICIDRTAPIVLGITLNYRTSTLFNTDVSVRLGVSDNVAIEKVEYSFNSENGPWEYYTNSASSPLVVSSDGSYTVYARAVDKAGNISSFAVKSFVIDKTAPTAPVMKAVKGSNSNYTLGLGESFDAAGPVKYEYAFAESPDAWQTYSENVPLIFTEEKSYGIYARAIDIAGNSSELSYAEFLIDRTKPTNPVITFVPDEKYANVTVAVSLKDGYDKYPVKTEYSLISPEGPWIEYAVPFEIGKDEEGRYTVYARTVDGNGNVSDIVGKTVVVDKTLPAFDELIMYDYETTGFVVSLDGVRDNLTGISSVTAEVWTENEGMDDLRTYTFPAINSSRQTYIIVDSSNHNFEPGIYNIRLAIKDNAGNEMVYETVYDLAEILIYVPVEN